MLNFIIRHSYPGTLKPQSRRGLSPGSIFPNLLLSRYAWHPRCLGHSTAQLYYNCFLFVLQVLAYILLIWIFVFLLGFSGVFWTGYPLIQEYFLKLPYFYYFQKKLCIDLLEFLKPLIPFNLLRRHYRNFEIQLNFIRKTQYAQCHQLIWNNCANWLTLDYHCVNGHHGNS